MGHSNGVELGEGLGSSVAVGRSVAEDRGVVVGDAVAVGVTVGAGVRDGGRPVLSGEGMGVAGAGPPETDPEVVGLQLRRLVVIRAKQRIGSSKNSRRGMSLFSLERIVEEIPKHPARDVTVLSIACGDHFVQVVTVLG